MGTRARAPHVPQHLPRGHSSLIPVRGSQTVQGTSPSFLSTQPQGCCLPTVPSSPFCKYVKRKKANVGVSRSPSLRRDF